MGTVETAAARALLQAGRYFVMMGAAIVGVKADVAWLPRHIVGIQAGVGRIRLGGVAHRAQTLRGHLPAHV